MIQATKVRGRGFQRVTHPNPHAAVIRGDWDIEVQVGPEAI